MPFIKHSQKVMDFTDVKASYRFDIWVTRNIRSKLQYASLWYLRDYTIGLAHRICDASSWILQNTRRMCTNSADFCFNTCSVNWHKRLYDINSVGGNNSIMLRSNSLNQLGTHDCLMNNLWSQTKIKSIVVLLKGRVI